MKIPANQLSTALRKSLQPCYLISGDEPLLVSEALDTLRKAARDRGYTSRDLQVVTAGFDWTALGAGAGNLSLFADKRLLELRLPSPRPGRDGAAAIMDLVELAGEDLLLVVVAPRLDKSAAGTKWVKKIERRGATVAVWPVALRDLPGWIAERMRRRGLQPDADAVRLLADRVEGNLLAAEQEIEKLRMLLGEGRVSAGDVETAVSSSSRYDVFKLADAAVGGDGRRAVHILFGLRAEGVEPPVVLWALTRELRSLAALGEEVQRGVPLGQAMKKARVWPNRQGLLRACMGRHVPRDFYRLLRLARQADAAAKGQSALDPWQLMATLVLGMAADSVRAA